jgi:Glycosyl transferases group 1
MRTSPSKNRAKRVVFAASDGQVFSDLRGPLVEDVVRCGHTVLCMAPHFDTATQAHLDRIGVAQLVTRFEAVGYNPLSAFGVRRDLQAHITAFSPDVAVACDTEIFPAFATAASAARIQSIVPLLNVITTVVHAKPHKQLRAALAHATSVIVETPEERRALEGLGWLQSGVQVLAAPSLGIDLQRHPVQPLPPIGNGFVFLLVTPGQDATAAALFAAAGQIVTSRSPSVKFLSTDETQAISTAHVVVHASSAPGQCGALLSALAMGRPIITTDVAGARDTVDERVNGCLVPAGDAAALAEAMFSFLRRMDLIPALARASRLKAERRYDRVEVNRLTLNALGLGDEVAAAA